MFDHNFKSRCAKIYIVYGCDGIFICDNLQMEIGLFDF